MSQQTLLFLSDIHLPKHISVAKLPVYILICLTLSDAVKTFCESVGKYFDTSSFLSVDQPKPVQ